MKVRSEGGEGEDKVRRDERRELGRSGGMKKAGSGERRKKGGFRSPVPIGKTASGGGTHLGAPGGAFSAISWARLSMQPSNQLTVPSPPITWG